jgi:pyruvate dehydrogenase E2 component (dihydrolipoamide acetyltransferase)
VAVPVTVPRLGWSMDEGTFVEWLKHDGDTIKPGDPLFVLESEKAAEPVEALDAGILRIAPDGPKVGETVKVGRVLAYIAAAGESVPIAASPRRDRQGAGQTASPLPDGRGSEKPSYAANPPPRARHAISPRARRVARELGIDCSTIHGTGAGGRIRERDVRAATWPTLPASATENGRLLPHTPIRRLIAARMVAGVTQAAPVTLTTRADATELVAMREGLSVSYTGMLVKFAAMLLREHPQLRAQWRKDGLFIPDAIDVAVAVDTEAGLLAPVLRGADQLNVRDVGAQLDGLIALARAGRLSAEQMRDATFTITNLGMFGIDAFTPIIHLPQSAVLGVGRIVREPAVVGDQIVPRSRMTLSLTFDHRVVDGAPAARFLDAVRHAIEQPDRLLE